MKKNISIIILSILFFSVSIFLNGCGQDLYLELQDKLSEVRYNLFECGNEEINIKFTSGFREEPYILNGKSENKKEFGVITVKFLNNIADKTSLPEFIITISDMDFDGEFELNPFDQTYVADIETFVLDDASIHIKIIWQDYSFEEQMKNISKTFSCSHKDALNVFIKEFKKNIQNFIKTGTDFEIYVKIINDPSLEIDKNYYYVCLITKTGESLSCVIDPNSSVILAKNESKNQVIL